MKRDLPHGLDDFLKALRAAGLPVGSREVLRLHGAFELEPSLTQDRAEIDQLRRILSAALVHSVDEQEIFDPVFRAWAARLDRWQHEPPLEERAFGTSFHLSLPPRRQRRRWLSWLAMVVVLDLAAIVTWQILQPSPQAPTSVAKKVGSECELDFIPLAAPPVGEFLPAKFPDPIDDKDIDPPESSFDFAAILFALGGLFLLSTAAFLARTYRQKQQPPPLADGPTLPGPRRIPFLPLPETGPELLNAEGANSMIWGVDRYQTEDLTPEIDLGRTVAETARRAGIPALRFVPEKRLREIWLWVDDASDDPTLWRYAEEIAASLEVAGLSVRTAGFNGYPDDLDWGPDHQARPQELESHRETALVAVLTDGQTLVLQAHQHHREQVRALLRSLKAWEHLTFVDFSQDGDLNQLLAPFNLSCIAPESLPYFLGRRESSPVYEPTDPVEIRAWTTALALSPRRVTEAEAYALRREMGLSVSPWALRVFDRPTVDAKDLRWLRDLSRRGTSRDEKVVQGSLLDHALDFWRTRLVEEDERRSGREGLENWKKRPARGYLEMELALLELWRDPDAAAKKLAGLAQDPSLAIEIRKRLSSYAPDGVRDDRISLPWSINDLEPATRQHLGDLGFKIAEGTLKRPGQLGLVLGLLIGLGLLFLGQGIWAWFQQPSATDAGGEESCPPVVHEHEAVGMRFVRVCAGEFQMGSSNDPDASDDEKPAHQVQLSEFWIGETEVTNAQYHRWRRDHNPKLSADLPTTHVSWCEARAYCQWLGESEIGGTYDLPSEAQWEYAARGQDGRRYPWGNQEPDETRAVFGHDWKDSPESVGSRPNGNGPFRTQDQAGNVWEWVRDCFDPDAYEARAGQLVLDPEVIDRCPTVGDLYKDFPPGWSETSVLRVLRGGSFWDEPGDLRSAIRFRVGPEVRDRSIGFRCLRVAHPQP